MASGELSRRLHGDGVDKPIRIGSVGGGRAPPLSAGPKRFERAIRVPRQQDPERGGECGPSAQRAQISRGVGVEVDAVVGDGHLEDTLEMGFEQAARTPVAPEPAQLGLV